MKKHIKLLFEFFRACMVEDLEYRTHFFSNVFTSLFWIIIAILTVQVFYWQTPAIGGWSYYETLVLLGVFNTINGFIELALRQNMGRMVEHIRKGTMDYILTKPIDSQFFVSFRHMVFWRVADMVWGLLLIGYALLKIGKWPHMGELLIFFILLASALLLVYSMWMILMTTSFWFVKIENLSFIFSSFFETTRFPVQAYSGWLRVFLTYVLPAAFITTVPSTVLIDEWTWTSTFLSFVVSFVFFALSRLFWKFALKHYTSASS